jgi:hypothetical protein
MKNYLLLLALISSVFISKIQGQNRTIVNAQSSEISDNLDLRVIASIFGDSRNLQEFEQQINDPKLQISNLDLNNDGQVDYLRVIESVEKRTHLVIIQSVLNHNIYQDVATIEVEKNRNNQVQIQVIGNSYFYGQNYIYEPIFYTRPLIYASLWMSNYRPYYSSWNWNYYPSYFVSWNAYPLFRYRNNVNICLSRYNSNYFNYVSNRRSSYFANNYSRIQASGYERQYPENSFSKRNSTVRNRYELDQTRDILNGNTRGEYVHSENRPRDNRQNSSQKSESSRVFSQNSNYDTSPDYKTAIINQRDTSRNIPETSRQTTLDRETNLAQTGTGADYNQARSENTRQFPSQRNTTQRAYSQTRSESNNSSSRDRGEATRDQKSARNITSDSNRNSARSENRRS